MTYIVLMIIALLLMIAAQILVRFLNSDPKRSKDAIVVRPWLPVQVGLALQFALALIMAITTVPTGHVGVTKTFGAVDATHQLGEGLHFVLPWQQVFKWDNRTTSSTLQQPAEAASHDMQSVHVNITVNWHIVPDKIGTVLQRFGMGGEGGYIEDKVVLPSILETFKSVISKYTAEELVTKRAEVSTDIAARLSEKMAQYDLVVEATNITNFQFSDQFNAAIEAKVTATQNALQAEQKLKQVKIEAEQRVAQAKGEAEAIQIQAQAIRSQGGAEYVQLQAIHKWNGELPQYMMGGQLVPFITLPPGKQK